MIFALNAALSEAFFKTAEKYYVTDAEGNVVLELLHVVSILDFLIGFVGKTDFTFETSKYAARFLRSRCNKPKCQLKAFL